MNIHVPTILIQQQLTFCHTLLHINLTKLFQSKLHHEIPSLNASAGSVPSPSDKDIFSHSYNAIGTPDRINIDGIICLMLIPY